MAELGISSTKEKDKMAFLAAIKGLREKDKAKEKASETPRDHRFQRKMFTVTTANDCNCLAFQNLQHLVMLVKFMTKGS